MEVGLDMVVVELIQKERYCYPVVNCFIPMWEDKDIMQVRMVSVVELLEDGMVELPEVKMGTVILSRNRVQEEVELLIFG